LNVNINLYTLDRNTDLASYFTDVEDVVEVIRVLVSQG
jgi:hypothetical protein